MTVTVMRDTIDCPRCGARRVVTARQRRRHMASNAGILCTKCRGIGDTRAFTDADIAWWVKRFGGEVPKGLPVRALVASGGAPPELVEFAHSVFPP
jgi:hypothetical protein